MVDVYIEDMPITKNQVIEMLETIIDPEVNLDIWTMGLIYNIGITGNDIHILMTFTSPFCPAGDQLEDEVGESMKMLGFDNVSVEVTFNPPWKPSAELKAALGLPDVPQYN